MSIFHEYSRMKSREQVELEKKDEENRNIQFQHLKKQTTTNHSSIPNMTSAYQSVRNSGYKPTEAEIHYRRYTGGRPVDTNGKQMD